MLNAGPVAGSARSSDRHINQPRRFRHPSIVGHDRGQLVAEELRSGQMNGVQTAQHARVERCGCVEKLLVDLHEVQPLQSVVEPG